MKSIRKLKLLAGVYVSILLLLLVCVSLMPLIIRHGFAATRTFIIEEETLETLLIVMLFAISYLLLRGLLSTLRSYRHAADQAARENTTLVARLADAFKYIGTVNVEIQEIQSVLCGTGCYPQSRREFRRCLDGLATKAMAITGSPWIVIRVIDHRLCRTVKECRAERRKGTLPAVTMGNRDLLEGRRIEGFAAIALPPDNLDLLTVCILPNRSFADAERLLLMAILNQFKILLLLHRSGCLHPLRK